jgi:septin family protein
MIPFAVCGSREVDEQGQHVRRYPWGTVVAEWEEHSDLKALRDALICVNMTVCGGATQHAYLCCSSLTA